MGEANGNGSVKLPEVYRAVVQLRETMERGFKEQEARQEALRQNVETSNIRVENIATRLKTVEEDLTNAAVRDVWARTLAAFSIAGTLAAAIFTWLAHH